MSSAESLPLEVDCRTISEMLTAEGDFLLVDCREQAEHDRVRIAGATLLPMSELAARVDELQVHQQRRIVVYCHLGGRSLRVAQWLRAQGYGQAQSMAGGIDEWARSIDTSLPTY